MEPTPGKVKVANEVIAQVAALTALQVSGVSGMADRTGKLPRVLNTTAVDVFFADVRFATPAPA